MLELVNTESTNISSSDISKHLWFGEIIPSHPYLNLQLRREELKVSVHSLLS